MHKVLSAVIRFHNFPSSRKFPSFSFLPVTQFRNFPGCPLSFPGCVLAFRECPAHGPVANMMRQQRFLKTLLKKLDCSPNEVIKDLEEVRFFLSKPSNMFVHMAGDLSTLNLMSLYILFLSTRNIYSLGI